MRTQVLGQQSQVAWIPHLSPLNLLVDAYGPAGGYPRLARLTYAVLIVFLAGFGLVLIWFRRPSASLDTSTRENFLTALAWAAVPTLGLIAASFVKPFYVDRYVTASAPGLALFIGLLLTHALNPNGAQRPRGQRSLEGSAWLVIVVGLVVNSMLAASSTYENYEGVTSYLERHVGTGGEIALPNHSVSTGAMFYLSKDHKRLRSWPHTSTQLHIVSLDLRENGTTFRSHQSNVWVVEDGTLGLGEFLADLSRHGYVIRGDHQFTGLRTVTVSHYERSGH